MPDILDIPDEVLLCIFDLLDGYTLKHCCLAIKRWNNLIGSSPRTMRNYKTAFGKSILDKGEATIINKNIYALTVQGLLTDYAESNIVDVCLDQLRNLKCKSACVNLQRELQCVPLLNQLSFSECKFDKTPVFNMPHLKELSLLSCGVVPEIYARDLTHLSVGQSGEDRNTTGVIDFLTQHTNLKSLKLAYHSNVFQFAEIKNVKFRLKTLGLHLRLFEEEITEDRKNAFNAFIALHKETLEELLINDRMPLASYQIFLTDFPNLTSLEIHVQGLPNESSFLICLPPLKNVRKLKLLGRFQKHEVARFFMKAFPSVERLDLTQMITSIWSSKFLKTISVVQPNIRFLSISNFFQGTPANLTFKHLQCFRVGSITDMKTWMNFVSSHRKIESIIVDKFLEDIFTRTEVEKLLNLPELRSIYLCGNKRSLRNVFEGISKDYKKLLVAKLNPYLSTTNDSNEYKIIFPWKRKDWNPKRYEHLFK